MAARLRRIRVPGRSRYSASRVPGNLPGIGRRAALSRCVVASQLPVFFAGDGVHDLEVLHVIIQVSPEGQLHPEEFLHANQQLGIFAAEALQNAGVDQDAQGVFLAIVAVMGGAVVKLYEWRQDVLYGPYLRRDDRLDIH